MIGGAVEAHRKVAVQLVPLANQRTDSARNRYLIDPESFPARAGKLERDGLEGARRVPFAPRPPTRAIRVRPGARLALVVVRDRRCGTRRAGEMKSWVLAEDRGSFDQEPITTEERKVVWQ